jgi:hypothetical protein
MSNGTPRTPLQAQAFPMPRREELFEQQERLTPQNSRDGQKSARALTLGPKGEIINFVERIAVLSANLMLFSPFLRIY